MYIWPIYWNLLVCRICGCSIVGWVMVVLVSIIQHIWFFEEVWKFEDVRIFENHSFHDKKSLFSRHWQTNKHFFSKSAGVHSTIFIFENPVQKGWRSNKTTDLPTHCLINYETESMTHSLAYVIPRSAYHILRRVGLDFGRTIGDISKIIFKSSKYYCFTCTALLLKQHLVLHICLIEPYTYFTWVMAQSWLPHTAAEPSAPTTIEVCWML